MVRMLLGQPPPRLLVIPGLWGLTQSPWRCFWARDCPLLCKPVWFLRLPTHPEARSSVQAQRFLWNFCALLTPGSC